MAEPLLTKAREYLPEDKISVISEAYDFAEKAHLGQVRWSGEPFIEHPVQTAMFLIDLRLDASTVAAALLHDVVEDCDISMELLEETFGSEVSGLVYGVTKLTKTENITDNGSFTKNTGEAQDLHKLLLSMAEDVRVVLIKLADRLHNMRTLKALPLNRRLTVAQETIDIYAPLAHRLGIWEMKWRLEDLAFQHINPERYREISKLLRTKRVEREKYIEKVRAILENELIKADIKAEVTGRPKHIYSIHKKIENYSKQNKEIGEIFDLFALRILVDKKQDCYAALGIVHQKWHPLPNQFDDYISTPKDNLYRSLHTSVLCENTHPVEVQIRTHEMHRISEYGIASHWLYKENESDTIDSHFEGKMAWLRQLLEWQRDISGSEEFVESFKTDIFKNQVFVYTPMGELKELPTETTPIDFAYRIHTDIGHSCIGAKINGKLVPLHYKLKNGDTVDIITSKTTNGPSREWLNPNLGYLNTSAAREKVRQWFNRQERNSTINEGRDLFKKQVGRLNITMHAIEISHLLKFSSSEELFFALGNGTMTMSKIVNKLSAQDTILKEHMEPSVPTLTRIPGSEIIGAGDLITRMAQCCNPLHGDKIIGYITRHKGITIHRKLCSYIKKEPEIERLIPLTWGKAQKLHPVRIQIQAFDRVGLLRDITSLVSDERVNIASCVSEEYDDVSVITLTVYISGIDQLNLVYTKIEGIKGVIGVSKTGA